MQLEEILCDLFPSDDPLDARDFSVTQYINALFPNEQSLTNLEDVIVEMTDRIDHLDSEVSDLIRDGNSSGVESEKILTAAQSDITELVRSITSIKTKAEESERMVSEITRDIKQLDQAKKNLTGAITTLNHLHIVLGGVDNLERMTATRDYAQAANLLQGVTNVIEHLELYSDSVEEIKTLSQRMKQIRSDLAKHVTNDFNEAFSTSSKAPLDMANVRSACMVADSLDTSVRNGLIDSFIESRLSEYKLLFDSSQEQAWFDKIDRRFAWSKKCLMEVEDRLGHVFPSNWEISERLAVAFCLVTSKMISEVLEQRHRELDVKLLLFAIQRSRIFEDQLSKRYTGVTLTGNTSKDSINAAEEEVGSNPFEEGFGSETGSQSEMSESKLDDKLAAQKRNPFNKLITAPFTPYLSIYVRSQERSLKDLLIRFVADFDSESCSNCEVLPSCADLFVYYKKCLVQCSQLSTGQALLDLSKVFASYLREYAQRVLIEHLPTNNKTVAQTTFSQVTAMLKEGSITRMSRKELALSCLLLNSADYCIDTISALEEKLIEKANVEYKAQIDLSSERDLFSNVITSAIGLLVQDMESACGPALSAMLKTNWGAVEIVTDQSAFISAMIKHINDQVPIVRDNLSTARKYYTQFCIKFVSSFIGRYTSTICKCKPISAIAAQQLLIDTQTLHTVLISLPSIGSSITRKAPLSYTKLVASGMGHAENILKAVMADHIDPEQFIHQFKTLLPDGDADTFKKVIDMKDLRRSEATLLLEKYRGKVTTADEGDQYSLRKLERLIKNRL